MILALVLIPILKRPPLRRRLLVAALSIAGSLPACGFATNFRSQQPHPAVARIIVPEGLATSYGSGTLVDVREDFGLVITNWHVVRDAQGPIEVLFPNGQHSKARALKVDADWDLAALVVWRPAVEPVPIAATPPQPGDELTICGYGSGIYRAATGRCTGYYAPDRDLPEQMVELDVQARQGDSGGPIFNARGELAGTLFGAGHGTTLGSFSGRVGSFLATLAPDIGQSKPIEQAIATNAESTRDNPPAPELPPAEPPNVKLVQSDDGLKKPADASLGDEPFGDELTNVDLAAMWQDSNALPLAATSPPPARTVPTGGSWFGHFKSILAAIGVVAIIVQVLRVAR